MFSAIKLFFKNYVNFSGRSRRSEYWWPMLGFGIINMILYAILMGSMVSALVSENGDAAAGSAGVLMIVMVLALILNLAILVPTLSVMIRRLHDIGKSGVWFFISFVPLVGSIVMLVFLCTDSQPGSNQWGPNPKGL